LTCFFRFSTEIYKQVSENEKDRFPLSLREIMITYCLSGSNTGDCLLSVFKSDGGSEMLRALLWSMAGLAAVPAIAADRMTDAGAVEVTQVIDDLDQPWAIGFLPGGAVLVTERDGELLHIGADGTRDRVRGVLRVRASGQGGLLDVMIPRDFASSREVFLSFSKPQGSGAGTALAVGTLSRDGKKLSNIKTLFELARGSSGGRHFGSRIVEGADGFIYLTIGDRGDRPSAQDLSVENGSVVRVARGGGVPGSNPFVGQSDARPAIWSYGHRNPQGAALDLNGQLWTVEHGAKGGDEVNLIGKGKNYGWPVISYGVHYSGGSIGDGTAKPGMEQPAHYWDPSIAPSGMMFYSGKLWPEWKGDLFIGSLKFDMISRLEGGEIKREVERIDWPETGRVRDIREAPDGSIWFISVEDSSIYRIAPKG
jgi:glucose/arabinose dehydrogenase